MALIASQYRAEFSGTTSTGSLLSADFTFNAHYVRVVNAGTLPLRATFASTVASTADVEILPGEGLEWRGVSTRVLGLMTTSTSTGGADHRRARVLALGGG